jgi:hypothetical protein
MQIIDNWEHFMAQPYHSAKDDAERWLIVSQNVSGVWDLCMGETWALHVYNEFLIPFWGPIMEKLDQHGREAPLELYLNCRYEIGVTSLRDLKIFIEKNPHDALRFMTVGPQTHADMGNYSMVTIRDVVVRDVDSFIPHDHKEFHNA